MKVWELIEELQKADEDSGVYIHNGEGIVAVDEVEIEKAFGYTRKVIFK
jgi:hypothetical protein